MYFLLYLENLGYGLFAKLEETTKRLKITTNKMTK